VFQALPLYGQGEPDRVIVAAADENADLSAGPIQQTGRNLDVAINGAGWLVVQASDGQPALTRNGALSIATTGMLQDSAGHPVLGNGFGPIVVPPLQSVTIGADGTISGALAGQTPDQVAALNRIMLTKPPPGAVRRRPDGLFQNTTGPLAPDAGVRLQVGALEGSNADTITTMMSMIETSRTFQTQTEMMRLVFSAAQGQSSPLNLS
jgi:flagellar basal-body rod protein FlgF